MRNRAALASLAKAGVAAVLVVTMLEAAGCSSDDGPAPATPVSATPVSATPVSATTTTLPAAGTAGTGAGTSGTGTATSGGIDPSATPGGGPTVSTGDSSSTPVLVINGPAQVDLTTVP